MTAMRGQVALKMCRKTPPNLALLDVNLPDMEGYDIGKVLRSERAHPPHSDYLLDGPR